MEVDGLVEIEIEDAGDGLRVRFWEVENKGDVDEKEPKRGSDSDSHSDSGARRSIGSMSSDSR